MGESPGSVASPSTLWRLPCGFGVMLIQESLKLSKFKDQKGSDGVVSSGQDCMELERASNRLLSRLVQWCTSVLYPISH